MVSGVQFSRILDFRVRVRVWLSVEFLFLFFYFLVFDWGQTWVLVLALGFDSCGFIVSFDSEVHEFIDLLAGCLSSFMLFPSLKLLL